jgi:hypothetical protein
MSKKILRVGLLLDDYHIPTWAHVMIKNILESDYASIDLAVINDVSSSGLKNKINKTGHPKQRDYFNRITHRAIRKSLNLIYAKLVERKNYIADAGKKEDCEQYLTGIPTLRMRVNREAASDYFNPEDIGQIKSYNIDILIKLGFGSLKGEILTASKYGVWSLHFGDYHANRGGPPGFWESMESWPEFGSVLQILRDDSDNNKVLCRSFSYAHKMSVADNLSNCAWKSLSFMTRKIKELHDVGEEAFFERVERENKHPVFYSNRLYAEPSNKELAKLVFKKLKEKAQLFYENRLFKKQWILMFDLKEEFSPVLCRYKKIIPPKDRFWADPQVIYKDNKYYIFAEECLYSSRKAHISLIVMDENGDYQEPEIVLERPYHLSYPFVFEHNGEHYMIPETSANRTVELYKCIEFPSKWEFQMNLMENARVADATVCYYKNKWWMFANVAENDGASTWDELFLFYSDDLFSNDWQSHPLNPIVSDCKTSRPAGKLFFENDVLHRVSQNSSVRYGYGFNILEVTSLDEFNYSEVVVSSVKPNWDKDIIATHTFNRVNSLHIIDALYKRRK